MPAWICGPVGAGVANSVPGAVRVALAGIRPLTLASVPRWQLSQVVLDGMCALAPIGEVGGMPTMRVMPAKVAVLPEGKWQAAQLLVMPAWLMREPENFAPSTTGSAVMLEPAPTWQASHDTVVGMWLEGRPTTLKPRAGTLVGFTGGLDVVPVAVEIGPTRIELSYPQGIGRFYEAKFNGYVLRFETDCALFEKVAIDPAGTTMQGVEVWAETGALYIDVSGAGYGPTSTLALDLEVADCPMS